MTGLARVMTLFDSLIELSPTEQESLLARECKDDPAMLDELRGLLAADERVGALTARPIADALAQAMLAADTETTFSLKRVGPYELKEVLGKGGMGIVYRAERVDGTVEQEVAIKFVRREVLSSEVRARFNVERQTLAAMDHPNIARLIDATELEDGAPCYVMEYVRGIPINAHCDRARLSVRARVSSLRTVCHAVAYAHRNLVVHRDLKPSNILVTEEGVPKLLDFGISKLLQPVGLELSAEQTATAQRFFSPAYAAPEQLLGEPISVGCDVYALGLLLCECLAGARPFDFSGLSPGQIERQITSVPPPPPSQVAARHGASIQQQRELRGDLDGIVLRCLRKSVGERYTSVEQLISDLDNYLEGRPVHARGGHLWYRSRKFVRRNWLPVTTGSFAALALIGGVFAFATQARIAERRASELEQVSRFQAEMLGQINLPQAGAGLRADALAKLDKALADQGIDDDQRDAQLRAYSDHLQLSNPADLARDLIDRTMLLPASSAVEAEFASQPKIRAALKFALASRYDALGLHEPARTLYEQSLDLQRRSLAANHADTLATESALGSLLLEHGHYDIAEKHLNSVLTARSRAFGESHPETLQAKRDVALLKEKQFKLDEAQAIANETLVLARQALGDEHPETLNSMNTLASVYTAMDKLADAEQVHKDVLDKRREVLGDDDLLTVSSMNNYGGVLYHQGKWDQAVPYFRNVYAKRTELLGEEHPDTLLAMTNLGEALRRAGETEEALHFTSEALQRNRRFWGDSHANTLMTMVNLGSMLAAAGKVSEGEVYVRQAADTERRVLGPDHPFTLRTTSTLGIMLRMQEKYDEAEPHLKHALEGRRRVLGETHSETLRSLNNLAALRLAQSRFEEIETLLQPVEATVRKIQADGDAEHLCRYLTLMGQAQTGVRSFVNAETYLKEGHEICEKGPNTTRGERKDCVSALVQLYSEWGSVQPSADMKAEHDRWAAALNAFE